MNNQGKQFAMVLTGVAADETVGHWWLGTFGRDLLPLNMGPWTVTTEANMAFMVAWPAVLAFVVWYAWFRKERMPAL